MKGSNSKILRDYGITVFLAVMVALGIRAYGLEAYRIPSPAMQPALLPGDILFVAKWPFRIFKNYKPQRGDIVVFEESDTGGADYIKRIIGLPGDEVSIRKGQLILNQKKLSKFIEKAPQPPSKVKGKHLKEKVPFCVDEQLPEGKTYPVCFGTSLLEDYGPEKVPENSLFVLGDSRESDMRKESALVKPKRGWGMVSALSLKGKALWIWLSINPQESSEENLGWFARIRFKRMFREVQ